MSVHSSQVTTFAVGALAGAALSATAVFYYLSRACEDGSGSRLISGGAGIAPPGLGAGAGAAAGASLHQQQSAAAAKQNGHTHPHSVAGFDQDDILSEQLTRNVQFFGLEVQKKIARSFVVVVGLGVCSDVFRCWATLLLLPRCCDYIR